MVTMREGHADGVSAFRAADKAADPTSSVLSDASHEQVVFCRDSASGLRAIIAIYSTELGPGTRRYAVLPLRH